MTRVRRSPTRGAKDEFYDVVRNFNTQTTEVTKSKTKSSLSFWLFIAVATAVIFISNTVYNVLLYLDEPIATSVKSEYFPELLFPNLSICKRYPFTKDFFATFPDTSNETLGFYMSAMPYYPPTLDKFENINYTETERNYELITQKINMSLEEMIQKAALSAERTFVGCSLRGQTFDCQSVISGSQYEEANYCFLMHNTTFKQTVSGYRGALSFWLSLADVADTKWARGHGWEVWPWVHNGEQSATNSPVPIMEGLSFDVRLKKIVVRRLNTRKSPCNYTGESSMAECLHKCEANATEQVCGCVRIGTHNHRKVRLCNPGKEGFCAYNVSRHVQCDCKITACNTVNYHAEVIIRGFEPEGLTNINLYYDCLSMTVLSETLVVTIGSLLGTFGGQASLWLGIRVASVIQVLYYAARAGMATTRNS